MDSKIRKVGTLLVAFGCASMCPACVAQASGKNAEYALADDGGSGAATAEPAVTTEIAPTAVPGVELRSAIVKELEAMKQRIAELEAELAAGSGATASDAAKALQGEKNELQASAAPAAMLRSAVPPAAVSQAESVQTVTPPPTVPGKIEPFSDADWTWLNGNPRNKDTAYDSKFFTPEIRADITYNYDFNKPIDDSMGGSSELFRANEIQLEQLGIGGDFHFENVRARFMTQFGTYSTATVRNDPSYAKGQWTLNEADRQLSEAYGGYHIDALHGINIDAGIFLSYIGLFSYYNFDNWAYQPSYVSSNTPWFFEGLRVQIFPTAHLKIEPWIINGWQSYASANSRKGLGGQIKYTPRPWVNIISNNYGLGHDDLYLPNRGRLHTDNSLEIKYYDHPENTIDKMAFSFTGDVGCEFGNGVSCYGDKAGGPKQSFLGFMLYDRTWFKEGLVWADAGRWQNQQSRPLPGAAAAHQWGDGCQRGDQFTLLHGESGKSVQSVG